MFWKLINDLWNSLKFSNADDTTLKAYTDLTQQEHNKHYLVHFGIVTECVYFLHKFTYIHALVQST